MQPALQVDLRRNEEQRPDKKREENARHALSQIRHVVPPLQGIPRADARQQHEEWHNPWRHEHDHLPGEPTTLGVHDVPFVPGIERGAHVNHEHTEDGEHAEPVHVHQTRSGRS